MSNVTIIQGGESTTIENPELIDCLCNSNSVAVDGEVYQDVTQVTFLGDEKE